MSKRSILVTGGCGFIGSHLVEALINAGESIVVLDNLQSGRPENLDVVAQQFTFVEGDVRDAGCVSRVVQDYRPQVVYHLAANASVPNSVKDPAYDFETNSLGTFVLLNELHKLGGCEKIVLASSGAVYGEPEYFPITESSGLAPISPYGASKLSAEITTRMFHNVYGLPVVIARLFNTYGPRMARFVVLDFLRKLKRDSSTLEVLGDGQQRRDFTHVRDTVRGLLILAERGRVNEAYNLSSGRSMTITELAQTMLEILSLKGTTQLHYTGKSWSGDAQRWEVSIDKMRALGYATEVGLDAGLEDTINWFERTLTMGQNHNE